MNIRQIWRQCRFDRLKLQLYVSLGSCMGKVVYMWLARGILSSIRSFWTTPFGLRMLWGLGIDSLDDKWRTNNLIGNISIASIRILVPVRVWLFTLERYLEELSLSFWMTTFDHHRVMRNHKGQAWKRHDMEKFPFVRVIQRSPVIFLLSKDQ